MTSTVELVLIDRGILNQSMREVSLLLEIEVKGRRMEESERLYRAGFGVKVRETERVERRGRHFAMLFHLNDVVVVGSRREMYICLKRRRSILKDPCSRSKGMVSDISSDWTTSSNDLAGHPLGRFKN